MPVQTPKLLTSKVTIGLLVVMLIISLVFFFLLSQQTDYGFGFEEIGMSIAFAIITTLFLVWIASMMKKSPYLGTIIGIVILSVFEYSLFLRFTGPYTTVFALITGVIVLIYFGYYFFRNRTTNTQPKDDFDDDLSKPRS